MDTYSGNSSYPYIHAKDSGGLFSVYVCDFTALTVVDAHDVIGYVGAVFGGLCALAAVVIAVRQFSVEKRPIIIPQNKIIYYYRNFDRKYAFQDTPDMEKQPLILVRKYYNISF